MFKIKQLALVILKHAASLCTLEDEIKKIKLGTNEQNTPNQKLPFYEMQEYI